MEAKKRIALVAHDNRKKDMIEWVEWNSTELLRHDIICTGTTGRLIEEAIHFKEGHVSKGLKITRLKSGPLGGDQQLGAMIAEGKVDMLIFLWDPMEQQPHDVDIKALLRIAVLYNIPTASNRSTADFIISSPLLTEPYQPKFKNYSDYLNRKVEM